MPSGHFIYLQMALMVGMFLGFIFGARAARNAYDLERRREDERVAARAAREARKAAKDAAAASLSAADAPAIGAEPGEGDDKGAAAVASAPGKGKAAKAKAARPG